ncbi:dienelactone hydrolase family protein [Pseudoduganella sp. OTU4001]|uniref:dienelactone hydrolase family protein n=1 Tax=Pseudoduganella sp. OTU4001 TaxID=3043854 RepID=UPI00313CA921
MTRLTARDFDPQVLQLFDKYVHGQIGRREFIAAAGAGLLATLSPSFAAPLVAADDKRINTRYIEHPSPQGYGTLRGYLALPAKPSGKLPAVLVVHENRGLNPHIEDITRRLALEGFLAFAPDALFPLGGYPGSEDKAREMFGKLNQAKTRADFLAAAQMLDGHEQGNGKIGVVGFCYGGGMANYLATKMPNLDAAVAFYGAQAPAADVPNIRAPLMIHDAENDTRIRNGWPAYETALKEAGKKFEYYVYPGVEHGFNNDTTPRYDEAAAKLAWQRTVDFFRKQLT